MKTIIITGAASGVGRDLAKYYKDHKLILIDKEADKLKELALELNQTYFVCDLAIAKEVEILSEKIINAYPTVDVLINNAGRWISGQLSEKTDDKYKHMYNLENIQHVINSNVFGAIALISQLVNILENGLIININSQSGVNVEKEYPIYNATKQAMRAYRKAIQDDLLKLNIKISDIHPGLINTEFYDNANTPLPQEILNLGLSTQDIIKSVDFIISLDKDVMIPSMEIIKVN